MPPHRPTPRLRSRLRCEALEDRRLLATYVVSSTADAGVGSLREAIDLANATAGVPDEIVFDETLFATPQAILLESQLPAITDALAIFGPGAQLLALDGQYGADRVAATSDGWGLLNIDDQMTAPIEVSISGVTLRNSDGPSAILNRENLSLQSVAIVDCFGGVNGVVENRYRLVVGDSLFRRNVATSGGAIRNFNAASVNDELSLARSRFEVNRATNGGAVYNEGGMTVVDSLFDGNTATSDGGAIRSSSPLNVASSSFVENSASHWGGALYLTVSNQTVVSGGTFSANYAAEGGAIYGGLTLTNSTVFDTRLKNFGAAAILGSAQVKNSVVAGSYFLSSQLGKVPTRDFFFASNTTDSFIGYGNAAYDGENGNRVGNETVQLIPNLAPLAYNGGLTPTHAPLPNSPLIDAGDPDYVAATGETDQRGGPYRRVVGGRIDIGAVEAQGPVTTAPGDFNGDGRFDAADYTIWRDSEGMTVAPLTAGDATGDGVVDETDRLLWASRYGGQYLVGNPVVNDLGSDDDHDIDNGRTTLTEAIRYANGSDWIDTITFDPLLSGGVITPPYRGLSYPSFQIDSDLTIDASMLADGITIGYPLGNQVGVASIFRIGYPTASTKPSYDVTFKGLTIQGGGFYAAIDGISFGDLTLEDVTIVDSYGAAATNWGAIFLIDSVVEDVGANQSFGLGGIASKSAVYLQRSEIRNARRGGVSMDSTAFADESGHEPEVVIVDSVINGVATANFGSVGYAVSGSVVRMEDSHVTNATAGGVSGGDVTLINSTVNDNAFTSSASAVYGGSVTLIDSEVSNNTGSTGTSIGAYGPSGVGVYATLSATLVRSRVENNHVIGSSATTYGGGVYTRGTVSLLDSVVDGNSATYGGGIYAEGRTITGAYLPVKTIIVSIVGSSVSGNAATRNGAGVYSRGSLVIDSSSISSNSLPSHYSGNFRQAVIAVDSPYNSQVYSSVSIVDTVLANNVGAPSPSSSPGLPSPSAVLAGSGYSIVDVTVTRSHVIDNQMNGVYATSLIDSVVSRNAGFGASVSKEVRGSTVSGNRDGGVLGGRLLIADSVIRGNSTIFTTGSDATFGLGGQLAAGVVSFDFVVLERSLVVDNHMTYLPTISLGGYSLAGGISATNVVPIDSTIRDNTIEGFGVTGGGVAVYGFGSGRAWFYRSTVSGNRAIGEGARGGGIYGANLVELVQSTVSGNSAEGAGASGGGLYATTITATHSTIANNAAGSLGGGVYASGNVTMDGTIVAGNTAPDGGPDFYLTGTGALTVNYSLLGDAADSGVDAMTGVGNLLGVDPLLGPLQDNGGPTWTHALLAGSPAIDAGDPARMTVPYSYSPGSGQPIVSFVGDIDQRGDGFSRLLDGGFGTPRIDMGAVERATPAAPPAVAFVGERLSYPPRRYSLPVREAAFAELSSEEALLLIDPAGGGVLDPSSEEAFANSDEDEVVEEAFSESLSLASGL